MILVFLTACGVDATGELAADARSPDGTSVTPSPDGGVDTGHAASDDAAHDAPGDHATKHDGTATDAHKDGSKAPDSSGDAPAVGTDATPDAPVDTGPSCVPNGSSEVGDAASCCSGKASSGKCSCIPNGTGGEGAASNCCSN